MRVYLELELLEGGKVFIRRDLVETIVEDNSYSGPCTRMRVGSEVYYISIDYEKMKEMLS